MSASEQRVFLVDGQAVYLEGGGDISEDVLQQALAQLTGRPATAETAAGTATAATTAAADEDDQQDGVIGASSTPEAYYRPPPPPPSTPPEANRSPPFTLSEASTYILAVICYTQVAL